MSSTVEQILAEHVSLAVNCVDRIYVNAYVPVLQMPGQIVTFLQEHLGNTIASPALLGQLGKRYRGEVQRFVDCRRIPLVRFQRGQRKDELAAAQRRRYRGEEGVVFLGIAQERSSSFKARKRTEFRRAVFEFSRQSVFVNQLYFYLQDRDWGPAFVKIGTYIPYPVKLCLNGHEWVKQQLRRESIAFESIDNGFLSCRRPDRLAQLCQQLGPAQIRDFFDRWSHQLPWPLTLADRDAGYRHQLSVLQIELSLTHVFDRPLAGRRFFDQVIRGNLDLGRPHRIRLLFARPLTRRTPPPPFGYRTRVITADVDPSLHVDYKNCHVKQYFKQGRALRTETTINNAHDFNIPKALASMPRLMEIGQAVNQRLLNAESVAEGSTLDLQQLERLQVPAVHGQQRIAALRFGDPRVMALLSALCLFLLQIDAFRNRDLRRIVERLLGPYTANQMSYDLRRLRLRGLITRVQGAHRYLITPLGLRVAFLFTKIQTRLLEPGWAALQPAMTTSPALRRAIAELDHHLEQLIDNAGLARAA